MTQPENKPETTPAAIESNETQSADQAAKDATHPICQNAKDQEKCEEFVEKLDQANENIDRRSD